jgi:hypothetical protein
MSGIHSAFLALGSLTIFSAVVFWHLKAGDGGSISKEKDLTVGD